MHVAIHQFLGWHGCKYILHLIHAELIAQGSKVKYRWISHIKSGNWVIMKK